MTVTQPILCDRFNRFNELIFGGRLPRIQLRVSSAATRAGSFSHRTLRSRSGTEHRRTISISSAFDLSPDALDDVIIHEMIHYWIDLYGPREAPHGPAFRAMMEEINRIHGRNIFHPAFGHARSKPKAPFRRGDGATRRTYRHSRAGTFAPCRHVPRHSAALRRGQLPVVRII